MKTISTSLFSLFLTASLATAAPLGKGWHLHQPESGGITKEESARLTLPISTRSAAHADIAASVEETSTTTLNDPDFSELEALAYGLKYDPLEIYRHVRKNYDYNAYSGIVKGALQTFYDRQGNDWDLSILTAKLLEISQAHNSNIESVELVHAYVSLQDSKIARWLGCENNFTIISGILNSAGLAYFHRSANSTWVERTWVRVTVDGAEHNLDVGWKQYDLSGPVDLASATGFALDTLRTNAGGNTGDDWVSGLKETKVKDYLNARTMALRNYLQGNHANDTCFEVLGGKKRREETITALPALPGNPYSVRGTYTLATLPGGEVSTIQFRHAGIDVTYPMHKIAGRTIALTYAEAPSASSASTLALATAGSKRQVAIPVAASGEAELGEGEAGAPGIPEPVMADGLDLAPEEPSVSSASVQSVSASTGPDLDFKTQIQGSPNVVIRNIPITSYSNITVKITPSISPGGDAFYFENTSTRIVNPGQTVHFNVGFRNSTLARGYYTGTALFEWRRYYGNNHLGTGRYSVGGRVSERASISYSGNPPVTPLGETEDFTIYLKNNGSQSLVLKNHSLTGPGASRFSWISGNGTHTVPAGGSHAYRIRYHAASSIGTHEVQLNYQPIYDHVTYASSSLRFSGESKSYPAAQLWIDDVLVASEANTSGGSEVEEFTLTIDHAGTGADQSAPYKVKRGASYVVASDFGASRWGHRLKHAQDKLSKLRGSGASDRSREVLTATLDVMGQTWMQQTSQATDLYRLVTRSENSFQHRFGLAAQEEGYYVDVAHQISSTRRLHSSAANEDSLFRLASQSHSALEHGVLEQMQVNRPATSTVGILKLANEQPGGRIYLMDSSNVDALTGGILTNYETSTLDDFKDQVANENARIVLPQDGKLTYREWEGYGYVSQHRHENGRTKAITMGISGDYGEINGGYGATRDDINPQWVYDNYYPDTFDISEVRHPLSKEPVDLATGAYLFDHVDLAIGQPEPRGIRFARTYNSFNARKDHGLGHGWDHNWNAYITGYSEADHGLLLRRPADAAAHMVAAQAMLELEQSEADDARNWALKSLVADWATDQLNNNALAVHIHGKVLVYSRLPDGSFVAPPGVTTALVETADGYELRGRFGTVQKFTDVNGTDRLTSWQDVDGKKLTVAYSGDKPSVITDAYGRTFTLNYSGGRIASVSDSTGRSVSYAYSGDGDQTRFTNADGDANTFAYDDKHQIIELRDPDNRIIVQNFYNESGRVYKQMGAGSKEWLFRYSDYQMIERDPTLAEKRFEYNERKLLKAFTDAEGNRTTTVFNGQEKPVRQVDARGNPTDSEYDNYLNLTKQTVYLDGEAISTSFGYDSQHRMTSETDPEGNTATHAYNARHRRTSYTNALGEVVAFTYTGDGQIHTRKETGENNVKHTTTYGYNAYGDPNRITHPDSTSESFVYNNRGQRTSQTDRRGHTTSFRLDKRGHVKETTFPVTGMSASATYDYTGNPLTETNPRGYVTKHTYSPPLFKRTGTTLAHGDPGGSFTTTFGHDKREFPTTVTTPLGHTTTSTLDRAGRVTAVTNPLGHATANTLDENGNITSVTTPLEETSSSVHDALNRLVSATSPFATAETVTRQYDANGNLTGLTNARGHTFSMAHDALNRLKTLTTPEGRTTQTTYTKRGQAKSVKEPSGQTTAFTYDALNRAATQSDPVGAVTFNHLDGAGDNTSSITETVTASPGTIANGTHTITRIHDPLGRVTRYTDTKANTIRYAYDHNSNITRITYPGAGDGVVRKVDYTYNSRDLLATVTDWLGNTTTYSYDADSRLTRIAHANGTNCAMTYDDASRLVEIRDLDANGYLVSLQKITCDAAGKITRKFTVPQRKDGAADLRAADYAATCDKDNRLKTFNTTPVTHDKDGNLTHGPLADVANFTAYTYDARNRLKNAGGVSYQYDFQGNRTKVIGTQTATWVNDPVSGALSKPIMREIDGQTTYYVWGAGLLYQINPDGTTGTYHYDPVGSTIAITADDGATVTDRIEYSPYGTVTHRTGTSDTPFLYNGRYGVMTDSNGLLHMRARYYNPLIRRFINADPIGFDGGLNWYAYAEGNPVSLVDPFGLSPINRIFGGIQAFGGALETVAGASIAIGTSASGVGIAGGGLIAAHGVDTFQAGVRQMFTGKVTDTLTSGAIQSVGVSQQTANIIDGGLGIASGGVSIIKGTAKISQISQLPEAAGISTRRALNLYESGSRALNNTDFANLGGQFTNSLNKGLQIEQGFHLTTTMSQRIGQSIRLAPTGLTPFANIVSGGATGLSGFSTTFDSPK